MDLGESDRLIRLLSPRIGRVSVVARRARASRRRFAGAFEVGNEVVVDARGKGDLLAVSMVELVRAPRAARDDLTRIALLCFGCEVAGSLAPEHAPAERLYGLLGHWLSRLEGSAPPTPALRIAFEAKALTFAGLGPRLSTCSRCGAGLSDPATWQADSGGAHASCSFGKPVSADLLAALEALRRAPLAEAGGALESWLLTDAIEYHLGRGLNTRALLGTGLLAG